MAENKKAIGTITLENGELVSVLFEDKRFYICDGCKFRKGKYVLEPEIETCKEEDSGKDKKKKKKPDAKNADDLQKGANQ